VQASSEVLYTGLTKIRFAVQAKQFLSKEFDLFCFCINSESQIKSGRGPGSATLAIIFDISVPYRTASTGTNILYSSVGGSGMFIPDPNFFHPRSPIRIKEFDYFKPKNCF
jgi:hypothetical protein